MTFWLDPFDLLCVSVGNSRLLFKAAVDLYSSSSQKDSLPTCTVHCPLAAILGLLGTAVTANLHILVCWWNWTSFPVSFGAESSSAWAAMVKYHRPGLDRHHRVLWGHRVPNSLHQVQNSRFATWFCLVSHLSPSGIATDSHLHGVGQNVGVGAAESRCFLWSCGSRETAFLGPFYLFTYFFWTKLIGIFSVCIPLHPSQDVQEKREQETHTSSSPGPQSSPFRTYPQLWYF
jgi:hypothetical protein